MALLVRRGMSVAWAKHAGRRRRREVYDVATEKRSVVIINCHVPHGKGVKEFMELTVKYRRAVQHGPVIHTDRRFQCRRNEEVGHHGSGQGSR